MRLPDHFVRPEYVMDIERIESYLKYIDELMTTELDGKNIDDITDRMTSLLEYMPVTNDMLSSSGYYLNAMKEIRYKQALKELNTSSPSVIKDYVSSMCADFKYLYDKCERTNKGLTHYLDGLRSLMSKEKELNKHMK